MDKTRTSPDTSSRIVITEIRDQEDSHVPQPAVESLTKRIMSAMIDLGLKATVENTAKTTGNAEEQTQKQKH